MTEDQIPEKLERLRAFLTGKGLRGRGEFEAGSLAYSGGTVGIRVVPDRIQPYLVLVDEIGVPIDDYDIPLLKDLLTGSKSDDSLMLVDEIYLLEQNWQKIVESFQQPKRNDTLEFLTHRREERVRARWPSLFR